MTTSKEPVGADDIRLSALIFIRMLNDERRTAEDRLTDLVHQLYGFARRCGATNEEIHQMQGLPPEYSTGRLRMDAGTQRLERSALEAKEEQLGLRFPDGYRNFLLNTANGGSIEPQPLSNSGVGLQILFGIDRSEEGVDLDANMATYRDLISPGFLPIGWNDFGDVLCLSLQEQNLGTVWLWDHENTPANPSDPPRLESLTWIAGSFRDFLAGKYPRPAFWDA